MVGTPWSMVPSKDGDLTTALPATVDIPESTDDTVSAPAPIPGGPSPRQIYIRKQELEKNG